MAKRLLKDKLIDRNSLNETLKKIDGSECAYASTIGNIYLEYEPNKFYKLSQFIIQDYKYANIKLDNGKTKQFRVHRLIAKTFIDNPNNLSIVGHKNNIKTDNRVENLYWTTTSENTKKAYDDGLITHNYKSWDDDQSIPVVKLDLNGNFIAEYGSMSEAAQYNNITKTMISFQCRHTIKRKPRKGYYWRYKDEFDKYGFVL